MKVLIIITLLINILACQQNTRAISKQQDINAILTNITIDALKDNDIQLAARTINAIILSNDNNSWDFLQSAIISLPNNVATKIMESALTLDSVKQSSTQLFSIAKIYISQKQTDKALNVINQAISLDKKNLEAIYWRARLLTIMKDYQKAEIDFNYITKKAPENQEYLGQYASYLQETKQYDKAQEMLGKQNTTPDSLFKRIIFSLQSDDKSNAKDLYQALKKLNVTNDKINHKTFLTAEAAYWLKNTKESEDHYRRVSGGKHYLDARDMLSLILFEDKRYSESIEILHQLQNAEEKYAVKAYRMESQIFRDQDNIPKAIETLTRSLELLPRNPILLYDRAMLLETQDKLEKMEMDLLQIIEDDPKNYEALNALGYSLADHDLKLQEAYQYILKAIELAPDNPAILDSLGWAQYKLKKYNEAEISFDKALNTSINDPELYFHMYKTLIKLNKLKKAQEVLNKAIELFPESKSIKAIIPK